MTSNTGIRKLINSIENDYLWCWRVLADYKRGERPSVLIKDFLDFQPRLAFALFQLNETYRNIIQEQKETVAKKGQLSSIWFQHRMRTLRRYQDAIKEIISIGKILGDSFAWIFYQNQRDYLEKHYQHEITFHLPTGIGAQGELEFIRNVKVLDNQLVLYHGITSFLRIGDISLVDLKTLNVSAIGELKTKRQNSKELEIRVHYVNSLNNQKIPENFVISSHKVAYKLPLALQLRLERQIETMSDAFIHPENKMTLRLSCNSHIDKLKKISIGLEKLDLVSEQAGAGLLLIGINTNTMKSLFSKFFGKSKVNLHKRLARAGINKELVHIMDVTQTYTPENANSFHIGELRFNTFPGVPPLLWWTLESEFLRKLIFRQVVIATVFNPAHLIKKLRTLGFKVDIKGRSVNVNKIVRGAKCDIGKMDYFFGLVTENLATEELIISMLTTIIEKVEAGEIPLNTLVNLTYQQYFD